MIVKTLFVAAIVPVKVSLWGATLNRSAKMDESHGVPPDLECRILGMDETSFRANHDNGLLDQVLPSFHCEAPGRPAGSIEAVPATITVRLIDNYCFSRECLTDALTRSQPNLSVFPFSTVEACIADERTECGLIVFHLHSGGNSDAAAMQQISAVALAFPNVPLVVLSDAEDAHQLKTVRNTLKCGARGVVATRTIGLSVTIAAIRLVRAGGTFAPMDVLLSGRTERPAPPADVPRQTRLTSRQMVVLSHIERGHANKTIAYELRMSESTVKVHVRNIMRKVGATNRTQAVYKAQKIWESTGLTRSPDV